MKIRKARKEDLKRIAELFKKGYYGSPYNERWTNKNVSKKINDYYKNAGIIVAVSDNKIKGFVIFDEFLWDKYWEGAIEEIVVDAREQGKGIGKKLMNFVEDYFKKRGIKNMRLFSVKRSKAFEIYKKLGYREEDLVLMRKKLKI